MAGLMNIKQSGGAEPIHRHEEIDSMEAKP